MKDSPEAGVGENGGLENGLPQPFVESMRTLFDILDDQRSGRVKFADIERRWHEDEDGSSSGLPAGVLDSLRVVTPLDGHLSFDSFCKGLQICLLRSKSGNPTLMPIAPASTENSKSNKRRSVLSREIKDDAPPSLPPPPPPSHDNPPPLSYHSHPYNTSSNGNNYATNYSKHQPGGKAGSNDTLSNNDIYTTNSNGERKHKTSATTTDTTNSRSSSSNTNSSTTAWPNKVSNGRSREPLPHSKPGNNSSEGFNLEQLLRTHNVTHASNYQRPTSTADNNAVVTSYDSVAANNNDLYNNSNNVNISVAQSRATNINRYGTNGITSSKLSPRKAGTGNKINNSSNGTRDGKDMTNTRTGFGTLHKTDIRMGTGGMMCVYGTKNSVGQYDATVSGGGSSSALGPPKPPRILDSQAPDSNINNKISGSNVQSMDRKTSSSSNSNSQPANSGHRVDNIINQMEALSTYGTSYSTNNIKKKEKIYDIVSKSRPGQHSINVNNNDNTVRYGIASNTLTGTALSSINISNTNMIAVTRGSSNNLLNGGSNGGTLPLSVLNGYSLQRSQTHSHISTHSLERDSRNDARRLTHHVANDNNSSSGNRMRRRGGSLERLLDGSNNNAPLQYSTTTLQQQQQQQHYTLYPQHHHSREGSNDTTSTAPAILPSHYNNNSSNNNVRHKSSNVSTLVNGSSHSNGATNNLTSASTNNKLNSNNNTTHGQQRYLHHNHQHHHHNKQKQQQSHLHLQSMGTGLAGNNIVSNGGGTSNGVGGSGDTSPRRASDHHHHHHQHHNHHHQQPTQTGLAQGSPNTAAAAVDHRLTMSSYAWIRGGASEDSSSSEAANTDPYSTSTTHPSVTAAAPAVEAGSNAARNQQRKGRRREARRHTLQNGLDFAAVRRAGELEAERDMLHQGLEVVEQARHWYRRQLHTLLYQLQHDTANTNAQYSSEAQQQKLHFQLARITEINTQLNALMTMSQIPQHLALATPTAPAVAPDGTATATSSAPASDAVLSAQQKANLDGNVKRLKNQNQQLTEEVSQKSQHISVLEQDKSRLLRELFQARATTAAGTQHLPAGQADSTFM